MAIKYFIYYSKSLLFCLKFLCSIHSVKISKDLYKKLLDDSIKLNKANMELITLKKKMESQMYEIRRLKHEITQLKKSEIPKVQHDGVSNSRSYLGFFYL